MNRSWNLFSFPNCFPQKGWEANSSIESLFALSIDKTSRLFSGFSTSAKIIEASKHWNSTAVFNIEKDEHFEVENLLPEERIPGIFLLASQVAQPWEGWLLEGGWVIFLVVNCSFHPDFWGDDQIWWAYLSYGLKAPTRGVIFFWFGEKIGDTLDLFWAEIASISTASLGGMIAGF